MDASSISITKVLANVGMVQAQCGCKPGRDADGWQEARSAKCVQDEWQQFATAIRSALSTLTGGA